MKPKWKNLLSVFGVALCTAVFTGCEVDADEAKSGENPEGSSTNSTTPPPAKDQTSSIPSASLAASPGTNSAQAANLAATEISGTNSVANQQTTVINPIPPAIPANLGKPVQEIVKLAQSGVSETVILLFIEKTTEPFNLDAAGIVYLNDIGISGTVIAAMLNHDGASPELQSVLTNATSIAEAPLPATNSLTAPEALQSAAPAYEVSSNYIAAAPAPGVQVVQQQPVVVEQQPVVVQQPVVITEPATTYSYFYSSLAPYGGWVYVTDYGWCWRPTIAVVNHGWRPYAHGGRWLYSDAGWYWHSDYSWGWAPFHYGRWYSSPRFGWVWTPDYVWGPSWVTWRRAGDYCGWAPLPPRCEVRPGIGFSYWDRHVGFNFSFGLGYQHYTFIPTRHFAGRRVMDHVVPTERTSNIYKNSTVVNNYIVGNNNTIINNGIGRDYVVSHTRSEVPKVSIRDEARGNRMIPPDRIRKAGNELVVYRPTPPPAQAERNLRETRERIRPSAAGPSITSGFVAAPVTPSASPGRTFDEPRRGTTATVSPRGEAVRPSTPARTEVPIAAYATPAPLRPEPTPSPATTLRPTRNIPPAGSAVTPNAGIASRPNQIGGGLLSTTPTRRPGEPSAPISRPLTGTTPGISQPGITPQYNRPQPTITPRTEVNRSTTIAPAPGSGWTGPAASAPAASPNLQRPVTPSVSQPSVTARPSFPARSPGLVSPRNEALNTAPIQRSITPSSPSVTTPRPAQPSVTRPIPNSNPTVPRVTPQPNVSIAPQPIRPSTPYPQAIPSTSVSAPPVNRAPVGRSESFGSSRPAVPSVQRPVTSAPVSSVPQISSPPVRSEAPRTIYSAPAAPSGGSRAPTVSAPPSRPSAAPPSRPSAPSGGGARPDGNRGRVEIGR